MPDCPKIKGVINKKICRNNCIYWFQKKCNHKEWYKKYDENQIKAIKTGNNLKRDGFFSKMFGGKNGKN